MRSRPFATIALLVLASASAHAETGDAIERALDSGVLERAVVRALRQIDLDAVIAGFEAQAQAAAKGQPVDESPALTRARQQAEAQARQAGPQLAQGAAALIGPVLREVRAEIGRELGALGSDQAAPPPAPTPAPTTGQPLPP